MGSVSDVNLTQVSGFLDQLKKEPGITILANHGFMIQNILSELNLLAFMEEQNQLPAQEVQKC